MVMALVKEFTEWPAKQSNAWIVGTTAGRPFRMNERKVMNGRKENKVQVFWEGHKNWQNFTVNLSVCSNRQINVEDFVNYCCLIRKHELYKCVTFSDLYPIHLPVQTFWPCSILFECSEIILIMFNYFWTRFYIIDCSMFDCTQKQLLRIKNIWLHSKLF